VATIVCLQLHLSQIILLLFALFFTFADMIKSGLLSVAAIYIQYLLEVFLIIDRNSSYENCLMRLTRQRTVVDSVQVFVIAVFFFLFCCLFEAVRHCISFSI